MREGEKEGGGRETVIEGRGERERERGREGGMEGGPIDNDHY